MPIRGVTWLLVVVVVWATGCFGPKRVSPADAAAARRQFIQKNHATLTPEQLSLLRKVPYSDSGTMRRQMNRVVRGSWEEPRRRRVSVRDALLPQGEGEDEPEDSSQ